MKNTMKLRFTWLVCACLACVGAVAETHVRNVVGECTLANITPEAARMQALEAAKVAALEKTGVEQNVTVNAGLKNSEINGVVSEIFSQFAAMEMRGGIHDGKENRTAGT